jgi:peptide/nickel transport system permease protein
MKQKQGRLLFKNKLAIAALVFMLVLILAALFAEQLSTHDPLRIELTERYAEISHIHYLGTDHLGRDIFSRLLHGARISLSIGFLTMLCTMVIGVILGALAGYFRGWVDHLIMRITDLMFILPSILLILTLMLFFEEVSVGAFILVVALISWPHFTRIMRSAFLSMSSKPFITSAQAIGCSHIRILWRHLLPNAFGPIIVNGTLGMSSMILIESSLSFLGFGIPENEAATWGNMLHVAKDLTVLENYGLVWAPPGIAIVATCLAIHFIGDSLRDFFDPHMK